MNEEQANIEARLSEPFEFAEVKFKPAVVSGNWALALAYVDARVIQDRLDDVLSVTGWQDDYECLPDGSVVCRLRLRIGDEWITKVDVGGPSEQPDGGDRLKAAFSDALKRAAVKFGIGRYLYRLHSQWVDYDPQKRQFLRPPVLPASALPTPPAKQSVSKEAPKKESAKGNGNHPSHGKPSPKTAAEFLPWVQKLEDWLIGKGCCKLGEFVGYIRTAGEEEGYDKDMNAWTDAAVVASVPFTREEAARWAAGKKPEPQPA